MPLRWLASRWWPLVTVVLLLLLSAGSVHAQAEPRWALVIGNDAYQHVPRLKAAVNDARAMADTLKAVGFQVIERSDATRAGMNRAFRELAERAAGAVAVVYYAGHRVQVRGRNYLLPVDLDVQNDGDVEDEAILLDEVLTLLSGARAKLTVVFVDACRDNPLPPAVRGIGRGLAGVTAPRGQMVVYSADAGEQALDRLGPGDRDLNGLFVRELIPELRKPGVALDDAVDEAAMRVTEKAQAVGHDQNPAIYKTYRGKYYLLPAQPRQASESSLDRAYDLYGVLT